MNASRMIEFYEGIDTCIFLLKREQENFVPDTTFHRTLWRMQHELENLSTRLAKYVAKSGGPDFRVEGQYCTNMTFEEIDRLDEISNKLDLSFKEVRE